MYKIVIHKDRIFLILLLLIFLPVNIINVPNYSTIITVLRIAIGCLSFVFFVKLKSTDVCAWLWGLYCVSFLISFLISGDLTLKELLIAIYPIGFFLIIYIESIRSLKRMIAVFYTTSTIICILFLFEFVISCAIGKLDGEILADNRNGVQTFLTFVIGSVFLKNNFTNTSFRKKDYFLLIVSCFGIIISGSATGIFSLLVGLLLIFWQKKVSVKLELLIYSILVAVFVVLQNTKLGILQFILNIFEKSSTFSNRSWRWQFSIEQFKENYLFGTHGVEHDASIFALYDVELFNPHNACLHVLLFGGIFAAFLLILLVFKASKINERYFSIVMGMIFVTALMESNMSPSSFVFASFIAVTCAWLKCKKQNKIISNNI